MITAMVKALRVSGGFGELSEPNGATFCADRPNPHRIEPLDTALNFFEQFSTN
jgi:hypothetical protein